MNRSRLLLLFLLTACCSAYSQEPKTAAQVAQEPVTQSACPAIQDGDAAPFQRLTLTRRPVRVLLLGDQGSDDSHRHGRRRGNHQLAVAATLRGYLDKHPVDFAVLLGDNFYYSSIDQQEWNIHFADPYDFKDRSGGRLQFYASLGNHDYEHGNAKVELERHGQNGWNMPARYYSVGDDFVRFYAVDTANGSGDPRMDQAQRRWLTHSLCQDRANIAPGSRPPWQIVFGHHPIATGGRHAKQTNYESPTWLRETLRNSSVSVYVAGHDHDLQLLRTGDLLSAISGAGGRYFRKTRTTGTNGDMLFCQSRHGFAVMQIGDEDIEIDFIAAEGPDAGESIYSCKVKPGSDDAFADCARKVPEQKYCAQPEGPPRY